MSQKHQLALLAVNAIDSITPLESDIFDAANAILLKCKEKVMSFDEFKIASSKIASSDIFTIKNEIKIKPKSKKLRYNGKKPHVLMSNVLGNQSIFLIQGQFQKEVKKDFIIEFNVDGKGSSRLPNGDIVNCPLIDISREFAPAFGIPEVERNLNTQWKMSPRHHPEVANKGVKIYLQNLHDDMS